MSKFRVKINNYLPDGNIKIICFCLLMAFLQGSLFVGTQLALTGTPSSPLDDTYIHLQYAKQIAQGHYFQYQEGEPVTSGETSFLYAHILAIGYLIGFHGSGLLVWAYLIAWLSVSAILYFLIQVGKNLSFPLAGWGAAVMIFCSGSLAWAFWSGMEIALFTSLLFLVYYLLLQRELSPDKIWIVMGLLILCRPEGGIVVLTILLITVIYFFLYPKKFIFTENKQSKSLSIEDKLRLFNFPFLFFIASIIGPFFFYFLTTGRMTSNSLLAKSLLYNPIMTAYEKLIEIVSNLGEIVLFFFGHPTVTPMISEYVVPGTILFALCGLVGLVFLVDKKNIWYSLIFGVPLFVVLIAVSTLEVWPLHNYRYLLPYLCLFIFLGFIGIETLFRFIKISDSMPVVAIFIVAILLQISYIPAWAGRFAKNALTIYEKQIQTAKWINQFLPGDHPIAINDAGALAYFGQRKIYDLVGLVTSNTTVVYRMGEGGLYESYNHIPEEIRPNYAVVFPTWFEQSAVIYDIFHQPLVTFPDPFDHTFGKTVYRINWNYMGMEENPREATLEEDWIVKDSLDVADIWSEDDHRYRFHLQGNEFPKIPIPFRRNFGYHEEIDKLWPGFEDEQEELIPLLREKGILNRFDIVDAGRRIDGDEQFMMGNLEPEKPAYLIMRTCYGMGEHYQFTYRMGVFVNDIYLGEWKVSGSSWNWYEPVFTIPKNMIKDEYIRIRIKNLGSRFFPFYGSYYYWICQEKSPQA